MMDSLFHIGLSNVCVSLVLAVIALIVGKTAKHPHISHLLWVLVLIKLIAPPIYIFPIFTVPVESEIVLQSKPVSVFFATESVEAFSLSLIWLRIVDSGKTYLPIIWIAGSLIVFLVSIFRVIQFHRLLLSESKVGTDELQIAAKGIARRLELKTLPTIYITSANISPMVWWVGGKVRVYIPEIVLEQMNSEEWKWVLAHELAHVKRGDYFVRWLEWLACVCFWWNPVVWFAQRNLRAMEEICCDALVLTSLHPKPQMYANSLLTAVEFLAHPAVRPPAMASEINSGGYLERRFEMIISNPNIQKSSRWLRLMILMLAVTVLPFGITYAQDYEAVGERLRNAVKNGEITQQHAEAMMRTLHEVGGKKREQQDIESVRHQLKQAVEDGKISREEAEKKMAEIQSRIEMAQREEERIRATEERIRAAVESGRMSREEAEEHIKNLQAHVENIHRQNEEKQKVEQQIRAAVQSGEMSREEAAKKIGEIQARMDRAQRQREEMHKAEQRIRASIETGEITPEEAREHLEGMKKRMEQDQQISEKMRAVELRIRAAVKSGSISREEARKKMEEVRKSFSDGQTELPDWDSIKRRIEGAVESGGMTREEADAKYQEIKEKYKSKK